MTVPATAAAAVRAALDEDPRARWTDERFTELALRVLRWQHEHVPVYRAWCEHELRRRGRSVTTLDDWHDIPALPIAAFKRAEVRADGADAAAAVWHSSGTTAAQTSRHALPSLELYEASLWAGTRATLVPDGAQQLHALCLVPDREVAPHSSLAHMVDAIARRCGSRTVAAGADLAPAVSAAWADLDAARASGTPVLVLTTSFALVHLLDQTAHLPALALAPGSRVMDTGGYKGRTRELDRTHLLGAIEQRLGIPPAMVENEYGMSELSSQAWLGTVAAALGEPLPTPAGARWQPPWFRTRVVDPATLDEVDDGGEGLLVHHDLANAHTCAAIRSEDWGRRVGDSYALLGRAPGALLRGCSLQVEDVL